MCRVIKASSSWSTLDLSCLTSLASQLLGSAGLFRLSIFSVLIRWFVFASSSSIWLLLISEVLTLSVLVQAVTRSARVIDISFTGMKVFCPSIVSSHLV